MSPATEHDRIAELERLVSALSAQNDRMAEDLARARGLRSVAAIRVNYPLIR